MEPVRMPDGTWAVFDGHGNQINGEFGIEAEAWDWIKSNPLPETEPEDKDKDKDKDENENEPSRAARGPFDRNAKNGDARQYCSVREGLHKA